METFAHGVCDGLRHTVWVIGRVESDFTFSTIATLPTNEISDGNAALGCSVGYWRHAIVVF